MRSIHFEENAFDEFMEWSKEDKKILQRISRLIQECRRTPFEGIGKPEALKGNLSGFWSRRIDEKHRMVYNVTDDELTISNGAKLIIVIPSSRCRKKLT